MKVYVGSNLTYQQNW